MLASFLPSSLRKEQPYLPVPSSSHSLSPTTPPAISSSFAYGTPFTSSPSNKYKSLLHRRSTYLTLSGLFALLFLAGFTLTTYFPTSLPLLPGFSITSPPTIEELAAGPGSLDSIVAPSFFPPSTITDIPTSELNTTRFFPLHPFHASKPITGRPAQRTRTFKHFPFNQPDQGNDFANARLEKCLPPAFWEMRAAEKKLAALKAEVAAAAAAAEEELKNEKRDEPTQGLEEDDLDDMMAMVKKPSHAGKEKPVAAAAAGQGDFELEEIADTAETTSSTTSEEGFDLEELPEDPTATEESAELDGGLSEAEEHEEDTASSAQSEMTIEDLEEQLAEYREDMKDWSTGEWELPDGCGRNETKIVLLNSWWYVESLRGSHTGEATWAKSQMDALYAYNYTMLFSSLGWMNTELWLLKDQYKLYEPFVKVVIGEPEVWDKAWHPEEGCVKQVDEESGEVTGLIEPWKMLSFHYWDYVANRLGKDWTLSPFPTNDHRFVSFSIEQTCATHPYLKSSERLPRQAYIFGKQVKYLNPISPETVWGMHTLSSLATEFDIALTAGMVMDDQETSDLVDASGINNLGKLNADQFLEEVSKSQVFIGIGRPKISPSPFDALCMGVPFINPILEWDPEDMWNKTTWKAQHWAMHDLEAPYVYNVHRGDILGLREAVKGALENPIESYIPNYMTFDYHSNAMASVVEDDWEAKYRKLQTGGA